MIPISANLSTSANSDAAFHSEGPASGALTSNSARSFAILCKTISTIGAVSETHLLVLSNLNFDVSHILRLQNLHDVCRKRFVSSITNRNSVHCFPLDHAKIELILISEGRLLLELFDPVLLGLVIPRTMNIIFVFFEETQSSSMKGLSSLFMVLPVQGV